MRKEKEITIEKDGRDKGKRFKIVEKSALDADRWANRVICLLLKTNPTLPEGVSAEEIQSMAGVVMLLKTALTSIGKANSEEIEALLDELLECCYFLPDNSSTSVKLTRNSIESIIEEVSTLWILRKEALALHCDFFTQDNKRTSDLNAPK